MTNAQRNSAIAPQSRRYELVIIKFAVSLLIYAGPMAYRFVQSNMSQALPSLRTVQRRISKEYIQLSEGEFRFDALLDHLERHKCPPIISIGEDATRIIARVEYDENTNRLVGFVLPCNENGSPIYDEFLAVSFEHIENCFKNGELSRYAFLYMAQPIAPAVPSFVLACIGTNNRFNAELVQTRWLHINEQCKKRGISVISHGADGDSREMKAMKLSCDLLTGQKAISQVSSANYSQLPLNEWSLWFLLNKPSNISYVQDTVHIGVKVKSRLLKPSIILPLGNYTAGAHHLHMIADIFNKDQHGLRHKDLDHKDRQNYDAVVHITGTSVLNLLSAIPDALGTRYYLQALKSLLDSYLNRELTPLQRLEHIWFSVYFYRYWRRYILLSPVFTISHNFLSTNAYLCAELNAHSLITFIATLRDHPQHRDKAFFMPWLLGSQCCEKAFRVTRSMTSTFSTVINFSMLGILRRLHRLQIQLSLESDDTGIIYPRVVDAQKKDGHNIVTQHDLQAITNDDILKAVLQGKYKAQKAMEELGMKEALKDWWEEPSDRVQKVQVEIESNEDDEDTNIKEAQDDEDEDESQDMTKDAKKMLDIGLITNDLSSKMQEKSQKLKKINTLFGIPLYNSVDESKEDNAVLSDKSPFVEVEYKGNTIYVRKRTVVWLLSEGERLSSDRLFRVRAKQPFSGENEVILSPTTFPQPYVAETVSIGDLCAFRNKNCFRIGKILNFANYKEKTKKNREYKWKTVSTDKHKIGVLCSWFDADENDEFTFRLVKMQQIHVYVSIDTYLCTLPYGSFNKTICTTDIPPTIMPSNSDQLSLAMTDVLTLLQSSSTYVNDLLMKKESEIIDLDKEKVKESMDSDVPKWIEFENASLTIQDKDFLTKGEWLSDRHVTMAQLLVKSKFPHLNGLRTTLEQKKPLDEPNDKVLQVIHINNNHWALISTFGCQENAVKLYDSLSGSIGFQTIDTVASLFRFDAPMFSINSMNVVRQTGTKDCALYAIAYLMSLAHGEEPATYTYKQEEMRDHLLACFERKEITSFPSKNRKVKCYIQKTESFDIYCDCRLPHTEEMICCDKCKEWYHLSCSKAVIENIDDDWYCYKCETSDM